MTEPDILNGKRILAVDDEPDVLDVIKEALPACEVLTAPDFDKAQALILKEELDLALLDIMGVNGFELLEECRNRRVPAAMLTAHAIDVAALNKSLKLGAVSFIPKEELVRLPELVAEILEGLAEGRSHWVRLFQRLGPFFKEKLGVVWDDLEKPPYPPYYY